MTEHADETKRTRAPTRSRSTKQSNGRQTNGKQTSQADQPEERLAHSGWQVAVRAAQQLQQLNGTEVQGITGLRRTDEGWQVLVDVLELRRVPNTTDVIATYEVAVDTSGELLGYRRQHRFVRGEVDDDR